MVDLNNKLSETRQRLRAANDRCHSLQQQVTDLRAAAREASVPSAPMPRAARHADMLNRPFPARRESPTSSGRSTVATTRVSSDTRSAFADSTNTHGSDKDSVRRVKQARAEFYDAVANLRAGKVKDLERRLTTAESQLRTSGSSTSGSRRTSRLGVSVSRPSVSFVAGSTPPSSSVASRSAIRSFQR